MVPKIFPNDCLWIYFFGLCFTGPFLYGILHVPATLHTQNWGYSLSLVICGQAGNSFPFPLTWKSLQFLPRNFTLGKFFSSQLNLTADHQPVLNMWALQSWAISKQNCLWEPLRCPNKQQHLWVLPVLPWVRLGDAPWLFIKVKFWATVSAVSNAGKRKCGYRKYPGATSALLWAQLRKEEKSLGHYPWGLTLTPKGRKLRSLLQSFPEPLAHSPLTVQPRLQTLQFSCSGNIFSSTGSPAWWGKADLVPLHVTSGLQ